MSRSEQSALLPISRNQLSDTGGGRGKANFLHPVHSILVSKAPAPSWVPPAASLDHLSLSNTICITCIACLFPLHGTVPTGRGSARFVHCSS